VICDPEATEVKVRPAPVDDGLTTMSCGTKGAKPLSIDCSSGKPFCLDLY
jgi:hypothetical protein